MHAALHTPIRAQAVPLSLVHARVHDLALHFFFCKRVLGFSNWGLGSVEFGVWGSALCAVAGVSFRVAFVLGGSFSLGSNLVRFSVVMSFRVARIAADLV